MYNIRFWPSSDGIRSFTIHYIGENNKKAELEVIDAIKLSTMENIAILKNEIGPLEFRKNELVEIQVSFNTRSKLALEVQTK